MRKFVLLAALVAGCNPPPAPAPIPGELASTGAAVVTTKAGNVTQDMVDAITGSVPEAQLEQMKKMGQLRKLEEQLAVGNLLYAEAIKRDLHKDPQVKMAIAMAERQALAQEFMRRVSEEAITDEKLQAAYDKRAVQYKRPQVHARHILIKDKAEADKVMEELKAGGDFAKLASEHSTDPGSKSKGGDLGWFTQERMVKPFADAAFAAEKGAVVGPVESRFGFHIIEVLDKRDATPLEDVKDELKQGVQNEAVQEYIENMKKEGEISFVGGADEPAAMKPPMPPMPPMPPAPPAPPASH